MDVINSQNLTHQDAYYHQFTSKGQINWGLANLGSNVINVNDPPAHQPQTTAIDLIWDGSQFQCPTPIASPTGNLVRWRNATAGAQVPTFSVVGINFNSRFLAPGDFYSHRFTLSGNYKYLVVFGDGSSQTGTIPVAATTSPAYKTYSVTIDHGKPPQPDPPAATVYVGDVVFWIIAPGAGSGITIKNAS